MLETKVSLLNGYLGCIKLRNLKILFSSLFSQFSYKMVNFWQLVNLFIHIQS